VTKLLHRALADRVSEIRSVAVKSLLKQWKRKADRNQIIACLRSALKDENASVRVDVASALLDVTNCREIAALESLLSDAQAGNPSIRTLAIDQVIRHYYRILALAEAEKQIPRSILGRVDQMLLGAIKAKSPEVREAGILGLNERLLAQPAQKPEDRKKLISAMEECLRDKNEVVCIVAASSLYSLGRHPTKMAEMVLTRLLDSDDEHLQFRARIELVVMGAGSQGSDYINKRLTEAIRSGRLTEFQRECADDLLKSLKR
jgi:HEAT repeat protein